MHIRFPKVLKVWNYKKNGQLKPEMFNPRSQVKVWWMCEKAHEWEATIAHITGGRGCPYCSNKRVLEGYNDLQTTNPKIAAEWHPTKNRNFTPTQVTKGSDEKVWWICSKGHEWIAAVQSRNRGNGCPVCRIDVVRKKISKPVAKYDGSTNELLDVYDSAREADKITGISYKTISLCCNGKIKTSGGYIWRFYNEN